MKITNPAYLTLMGIKDTRQEGKLIKDISDIKGNIRLKIPSISVLTNSKNEDDEKYAQVASLAGSFILNDDRINTYDFVIKLNEGECLINADVKIEETPYLKANISLDSIEIENYARIFGGDVPIHGGIINGQVNIAGKTTDLNGDGEIFIHDLAVSTRNINPIIIPIRIKSNTLKIPDLLIASDNEKINIALEFNPDGNYDLSVNSSPFDILGLYEDVMALQDDEIPSSEINKIPKPGGSLQISLAGNGNIKNPSLDGKISMKDLRFNGEVFGDGECLIDVGNNKAKVDVYLFDRTMTANLVSDIKEPFPFNAELQMNNLSIEPALRLAKAGDIIDLNITGNIKAYGEGQNPMDVSVDGILQSIILSAGQYEWNNKLPIKLSLRDRKFELNGFEMEGDGAKISTNANAKITGSGKNQKVVLSAEANIADINLAVIADILDFPTHLSGNINCNINVEGDLDSPNALVKIESPGIEYDQFDIDSISGAITYKEGLIEIEKFLVNAFGGEANINFAMPFDIKTDVSLTPEQIMEKNMRFSLDVKDINLAKFEELSPDIEALKGKVRSINLNAMGNIKQPRINGSVNLIDGFVKIKDVPVPIDNLNGQIMLQNSKEKVNDDLYEISDNEYDTAVDFSWNMDKGSFGVNGIVKTPRDFIEYILKQDTDISQNIDDPKVNPFVEKFISIIRKPLSDLAYPKLNFDIKMDNTEVSPWVKGLVKDMEIPIDGDVSGNIHIEGEIYNPKGTISINPVRLTLNDQEIRNPEPINIDIADRIIDISSFNLNFKPSTNDEIGTVVIKGNANIDAQTYSFGCYGNNLHPSLATFLLKTSPQDTEQDKPQTSVTISDGNIGFSIDSKGKFDSPTATITADVSNIVIPVADKSSSNNKEAKIDKVLCSLSYNDGMFNIEQINIITFGNSMNIKGKIPADISLLPTKVAFPDKEMDVDLVMDNFGLEFLNTLVDNIQDFDGNAQANIKVFGTVNDPKLSGNLSMKNAKCTVLAVTTPSQKETSKPTKTTIDIEKINLKVIMDSEKIDLDDVSFSIGEGNYKADGSLKLGSKLEPQDFEVTFKTEPAMLNPFIELGGEEIISRLSGDIKSSGDLKGDIRSFKGKSILDMAKSLTGSMNIEPEGINIIASGHRITNPRRIYAELKKGRLNLPSFKIMDITSKESDATSLSALGMWEIGGDKSFDLTAIINGKLVTDLIDQPDITMQGSLGFKLEARDDEVNVFWPPRGNEESSRFTFQNASIDEFRGELKYKNQNIDINQIWLAMGENKVSISGFVPLTDRQMSLQMDARMNDMSILTLVNKEISESSGKITLGATVTGNLKKVITNEEPLDYVGSCLIENLNANLERAFVNFEDIDADISFNSKSISAVEFNELSGKMNDGDFFLNSIHKSGIGIKWSKESGYRIGEFRNITLSMKDCTVFQPQVYSIVFDADPIQLRGDFDNPKLTGNVTLKEGLYNESLQSLIQNVLSSRQIGVKAFLDYPIVKNLVLDVNLIHGNMRMDNGIIDADAEIATARVTGSLADPIVRTSGRITQGKFTYLNREFNIKKGEFTNDGPINPQYDIIAETELSNDQAATGSNVKIQMQIKGSLTERYPPEFSIIGGGGAAQETPDLSQNQIAAIIALGISPDQSLSRAFSSSSPLLVEPAKQYFESQAEKMLRLKEFKMQVDPRNPRETRLAAAKQLTKDISVTFDVGYGGQQWFGIQRDLLKNIALAGKISQEGDWGFDLKVEREFK
ncbi:TPA: hypothetical protein ENS27_16955 [bacterium]|nr:hypothetical protein [bacterium]